MEQRMVVNGRGSGCSLVTTVMLLNRGEEDFK